MSIDIAAAQMVINGLINTITAYMTYKVGVKQAEGQDAKAPPEPSQVSNSEQALSIIEEEVIIKGLPDEQMALAGFKQNPELFKAALIQTLLRLVERNPSFLARIQMLTEDKPEVSRGGSVHNEGDNYGAQGQFNASVNIDNRKS